MRYMDADEILRRIDFESDLANEETKKGIWRIMHDLILPIIYNTPTVDAEHLGHAHWEEFEGRVFCSACVESLGSMINLKVAEGSIFEDLGITNSECYDCVCFSKPYPDFCPNCGSIMDEEEEK